jgi:hypothetical protein
MACMRQCFAVVILLAAAAQPVALQSAVPPHETTPEPDQLPLKRTIPQVGARTTLMPKAGD